VRKHTYPTLDYPGMRKQAAREGMRPLRLAGAMKVAEGVTTLDEVLRCTPQWE
jgi:general secretion pathway protein E